MSALDERSAPLRDRTRSQIVAQVLQARANRADFLEQMQQRQKKGWEIARQCAKILKELQELVSQAERLLNLALKTEDPDYLAGFVSGLALHLHGFYTGVERIFYLIARATDGNVPTGSDWHKQLLNQMLVEIPSIRASVVSEKTYQQLNADRGFRHVVRSLYAYKLDANRVLELTHKLKICHQIFER